VTASWFGEAAAASNVYAFEANLTVMSVRGLNTAASRLLSEGWPRPVDTTTVRAEKPKKKAPSPDELIDKAVSSRAQAVEEGDYATVWNTFSRRKRSEMVQAGMSREGFVRLPSLTNKLESGLHQSILKSAPESATTRLVLVKETHPARRDVFLKQRWMFEEGEWKLDDEQKKVGDAPAAPSAPMTPPPANSPETAPTHPSAGTPAASKSPSTSQPSIPVRSLPGLSN